MKSVARKREKPVRQVKRCDLAAKGYFSMRKPFLMLVERVIYAEFCAQSAREG